MKKSKIILILKSFSPAELKKFREYLGSPYFNKNKTLIKFFNELQKEFPDFPENKIRIELIYSKLFPGKMFNQQVMKNLISGLFRQCKEFLEIEHYKRKDFERKLNLLNHLNLKKLDAIFKSELSLLESELSCLEKITDLHFLDLHMLEDVKVGYHLERNEQANAIDKVLKSGEYLVIFFIIRLIKTNANLIVNTLSFNASYDVNLPGELLKNIDLKKLISFMKKNNLKYNEILELFYYRILCYSDPHDETHYFKFKELLAENLNAFNRDEIYGLFNSSETYCIFKINSGATHFLKELFNVFQKEIENGYYKFSDDSPVTFMKFRNTFLTALDIKEYIWAENFIENFKKDLIESERCSIVEMSYAHMNFEKGNFEKVNEQLQSIVTDQLYLKIDLKNLLLMTHYELNYTESALSMIDAYKHFLAHNKLLTQSFKENNLRFANALNSLIWIKEKPDKNKLIDLEKKITEFGNDRKIKWLKRKIEAIMK